MRDRKRAIVLDGGLATHLQARGARLDDPLWSGRMILDAPDELVAAHRDFLDAGAQVISAATYQLSGPGLAQRGLIGQDARDVFERGVGLARRAVMQHGGAARVAASIGSYGAHLCDGSEYRGDFGVGQGELRRFHATTLSWSACADLALFETVPSAQEVRAIAALVGESQPGPVALSLVVADAEHLADATPLAELVAEIDAAGLLFLGINCVAPDVALAAGEHLQRLGLRTPLALYPNRGHRYQAGIGWARPAVAPLDFAAFVERAADLAVAYVGGCCQTGPAEIAAACAVLDAWPARLDAREPAKKA